jgi:hypothetical protein
MPKYGDFRGFGALSKALDSQASPINRDNISKGIYQIRTQAINIAEIALLRPGISAAVVLYADYVDSDFVNGAYVLDPAFHTATKTLRIFFRIPNLHASIPIPPSLRNADFMRHLVHYFSKTKKPFKTQKTAFSTTSRQAKQTALIEEIAMFKNASIPSDMIHLGGGDISALSTSAQDELFVLCHPAVYVDPSQIIGFSVPNPGDIIELEPLGFRSWTYNGQILKKGTDIVNFRAKDLARKNRDLTSVFKNADPINLRDVTQFKWGPKAHDGSPYPPCTGAPTGELDRAAKEIGFNDPLVLAAIREKEIGNRLSPRAIRFEANLFLDPANAFNINQLEYYKDQPGKYGYVYREIFFYTADKTDTVSKKFLTPIDAAKVDLISSGGETYLTRIKTALSNPSGKIQKKGGIIYHPDEAFFSFSGKDTVKVKIIVNKEEKIVDRDIHIAMKGRKSSVTDHHKPNHGEAAFLKAFTGATPADKIRAIRSTSFGQFQVMGWALLELGDHDPDAAIELFLNDPEGVGDQLLKIFFKHPEKKSAIKALNTKLDSNGSPTIEAWEEFARAYNGKACCQVDEAYVKANPKTPENHYHVKIKKIYDNLKKNNTCGYIASSTHVPADLAGATPAF